MRLAAALLLALVCATPAAASTVSVSRYDLEDIREDIHETAMRFAAAPGERNRLTVRGGDDQVTFVDRGARLRAGRRCRSITRHKARCRFDGGYRDRYFRVRLGDRADAYRSRSAAVSLTPVVLGGAGADRLRGGPGVDELSGERGADTLRGGAGDDVVHDGPGRDAVAGGRGDDVFHSGPAGDRFDGGRGRRDTVSYEDRREPVTGSLDGVAGERGERDVLVDVEGVTGGRGDDVLRGTAGKDVLDGGPRGVDRLYGRGGDDELSGSAGAGDRLSGGAGDDAISPYAASTVACGAGRDLTTALYDEVSLLRPSCERYGLYSKTWPAQPIRLGRRAVVMRLPCATRDRPRFRRVQLLVKGGVLAQGRRRVGRRTCRVRLSLRRPVEGRTVALVHYVGGGPDWRIILRA